MKQLEVFNKIGGIIKELNDQYKYIETNPENINDLELELFVANAHFLTDHAEILSKLNQRNKAENLPVRPAETVGARVDDLAKQVEQRIAPPERKPVEVKPAELENEPAALERTVEFTQPKVTGEKFFEPVVQQPKRDPKRVELAEDSAKAAEPAPQIDLSSDTPNDSYSFIMEEPEVIRHELVVEDTDDTDEDLPEEELIEDTIEEDAAPEEVEAVKEPELPVMEAPKPAAKVEEVKDKEEVLTINQRMSSQRANLTEQAGAQPVTNLKAAITLNDKLLYIKDLFNGYSLAYSEAIEILNRFNTFEEANRFLNKNYTLKNNWDSKPETADKFFALLKRRYS